VDVLESMLDFALVDGTKGISRAWLVGDQVIATVNIVLFGCARLLGGTGFLAL